MFGLGGICHAPRLLGLSHLPWQKSRPDKASGSANVRARLRTSVFISQAVPASEMLANDLESIPRVVLSAL
jgi:hypothetical protein